MWDSNHMPPLLKQHIIVRIYVISQLYSLQIYLWSPSRSRLTLIGERLGLIPVSQHTLVQAIVVACYDIVFHGVQHLYSVR